LDHSQRATLEASLRDSTPAGFALLETMKVTDGSVFLLERHLESLQ
jgi:branched-subunit amino acid aminotransferase/4-amino-4-deoxychorismate lyase